MGRDNLTGGGGENALPIFLYRTLSRNSPGEYMRLVGSTRTHASKEDQRSFPAEDNDKKNVSFA